jgi:ABC-type branched-subunit amino acid transport system substrate-binding protein
LIHRPSWLRPAAVALFVLALPAVLVSQLTPDEERGKAIYSTGKSATGKSAAGPPITVTLGEGTAPLPAETLPCLGCHGPEGRGRPEGGVAPSDIRWSSLTRPYEVTTPSGRKHPAYDRRLAIRAITLGIDPAGNRLGVGMPRYQLSREDADALVAYLQRLGQEREPGVSEKTLQIGTLLPSQGRPAEMGKAIEAALRARFSEVNAAGGVYGRTLELTVARTTADLAGLNAFALVAPLAAGTQTEDAELAAAQRAGLPVIGPVNPTAHTFSGTAGTADRTFYLLSGFEQQARVLWDFAAGRKPAGPFKSAVVWTGDSALEPALQALRDQARRWKLPEPEAVQVASGPEAAALARSLQPLDAVFFLGPGEDAARLLAAFGDGPRPDLYLPVALAGPLASAAPPGVFLSFPTLPADTRPAAQADWQAFARKHQLPAEYPTAQRLAAVAADLLTEALRRTGKDLTREKLVQSLEKIYIWDTGLTPRLSFGPGRHVGSLGGYVVEIGAAQGKGQASGWIEPR